MDHAISFDILYDAAAFVGALSRYVSSPPGLAFGRDSVALLAWIQAPARAALFRARPPLTTCIPIPLTSPRVQRGKDEILQEVARAAERHNQWDSR